ncbi:calcium-binding protein [Pseudomonas xanthosomatis]|uniref:beta strand repeat-containing protein n=1 Tax=Pseudomonas xanthosomatis TaxID=2842356 RepID=UPI001C3C941D|nr:calcium-binding protein [Pseudomonas xanthosomatis]QXH45711.1 calcium-binding protein [Pseudomonas xanthosomatis]
MATITLSRSFSFLDPQDWSWDVTQATGSSMVISDGVHTQSFGGRFVYFGDYVSGTVTSSTFRLNGATVYSATGMNKSLAELAEFAMTEGDTLETYAYVLDGNDTLLGSTGNDTLLGFAGDDLIDGRGGADIMIGGVGNDTYVVDNIGDQVQELAGEGIDTVNIAIAVAKGSYTLGANVENGKLTNAVAFDLTGNALNNTLTGNAAANRLDGGLGADTLNGGAGNDTYVVDNLGDLVIDSAGIDTVEASISYTLAAGLENLKLTGSQAINGTGNAAANLLDATQNSAANVLTGGKGNDTYLLGAGDTAVELFNEGIDLVQTSLSHTLGANLENLTLLGNAAINGTGNELANVITGNSGDNVLDGGDGVDTLQGGAGNDTYSVSLTATNALQDKVIEALNQGTDTLRVTGGTSGAKLATLVLGANLENLDAGQTGAVLLNLTGNTAGNELIGNDADNLLSGLAGDDILRGGLGNDTLNGGVGSDQMFGGQGNDTYYVDSIGDSVVELAGEGTDTVNIAIAVAKGSYTLGANVENGKLTNTVAFDLTGNALNNQLTGNAAANVLDGGAGADTMNGGAGNDTYYVDDIGDVIIDSAGLDTVISSISFDLQGSTLENLTLTGSNAINATGNALANVLDGWQNSAANLLTGGKGNDTYVVGAGDTVVEGLNEGTDLVQAHVSFTLGANLENLTLMGSAPIDGTGNALNNTIIGNASDNRLDGGAGVDKLQGGVGNDTYLVDLTAANALQDSIIERVGEGVDTVLVRGGTLGLASKTITLGANLDNLDISDTNAGVRLNLVGNTLDNVLTGNSAQNVFTGGRGHDAFRFDALDQLGNTLDTRDTITDFKSGEDLLDFTRLGDFRVVQGDAAFTGGYQLKLVGGVLYGTLDNDDQADFQIVLTGVKSLTQDDLMPLT